MIDRDVRVVLQPLSKQKTPRHRSEQLTAFAAKRKLFDCFRFVACTANLVCCFRLRTALSALALSSLTKTKAKKTFHHRSNDLGETNFCLELIAFRLQYCYLTCSVL